MCGISGILDLVGARRSTAERQHIVRKMLGLISYRGPDHLGHFVDERVAIGAVRLSVVDLQAGTQPMCDASRRWWIVYNGEIYNHVELRRELEQHGVLFQTRCDTEVALQAWIRWGVEGLSRLEGGFAFAVYDSREKRVDLVRDRFGKRPLFFRDCDGSVLFASEMKSFLAFPGAEFSWDSRRLSDLFAQWTLLDGDTPFKGIRQVPAGSVVTFRPDGEARIQYACFEPARRTSALAFKDAVAETAARLEGAVQRRIRCDVEPTVLLSGGVDSAIIAYLMRRNLGAPLRGFSIGFANAEFDESEEQRRIAKHLDIDHHHIRVDAQDIAAAFPSAVTHAEIPQFRTAPAPMYLLYREIAAAGIKVTLSGEGADEVFLGYDIFKETRLRANWSELTRSERRVELKRLYPYLSFFSDENIGALEAVFARAPFKPKDLLSSHAMRLENGRFAQRLLNKSERHCWRLTAAARKAGLGRFDPVSRAQWIEFVTLLQGYLLSSQGDRMSFAHGVESRNPFLAPDVVDFASGLPEADHLTPDGAEKNLLKQAFSDVLPHWLLSKPKKPYRAPDAETFREAPGRLLPWVEECLAPSSLRSVEPVDANMANRLVDHVRSGARKLSPRDNQAFVLLLSLSILNQTFVNRNLAGAAVP